MLGTSPAGARFATHGRFARPWARPGVEGKTRSCRPLRAAVVHGVEYTEYYLPDGLSTVCLFRIETKVPDWVKMTQEEWDNGQNLCLESRIRGKCWLDDVKGKVWGGDIMKPVLME